MSRAWETRSNWSSAFFLFVDGSVLERLQGAGVASFLYKQIQAEHPGPTRSKNQLQENPGYANEE